MKLQFYLIDLTYKIEEGKPVIYLFGRDSSGRQVCVVDRNFEPYFYVVGNASEEVLLGLKQDDFRVVRVESVKKNLNEKETAALKVFVNIPKAVPALKDLAKSLPGVKNVYEYDILFTRRYLLDKGIVPLCLVSAEVKEVQLKLRVPCFQAASIISGNSEVLTPRILAVDIETYNADNRLDFRKNPVLMIGLYGENFSRVITWKKFRTNDDYIEFVGSEGDCIKRFVELVHLYAPDMIAGYFSDGFDFPYLAERAKINKAKLDLGLDFSNVEILGKSQKEARISGICHFDVFKFIRKVVGRSLKTDSLSLDSVSMELLGEGKNIVEMNRLFTAWDNAGDELGEFCRYNLKDCVLAYKLAIKIMPSLVEFVRIIGLPPYDINRMTFSTFVEWYLINQAVARNEIAPNRPSRSDELKRISDRIKGAFVYEPKPGFYENIMVFDYRSLYPSIIASHNISRGTINCECCPEAMKIETERGVFWYCEKNKGLFSAVISELILRRAEIKKQLKVSKDAMLAARSEALKVLANSFYGYLGFAPARFYSIECAESTTAWARHYIHKAIDGAKSAGFTVLYSDTDSLFVLLGKKTKAEAIEFMEQLNKQLPGVMELDYEGFYPTGIFVSLKAGEAGAKKKYALVDDKGGIKIKGFETVRRNWSFIAREVQREVLGIVLKERDLNKAKSYVKQVIEDLRANKIAVDRVVIRTAMSKDTEDYTSVGPHVAAARQMKAKGISVGAGSVIDYVVVKGKGKIRDKVKLPGDTKQDEYDGEYYVQNQIIPGVERIFAVLNISIDELASSTKQRSLEGFS